MKYLLLIGDGMADYALPELDGKTPLEAASTPAMDEAVRRGLTGLFYPIPEGLPPGSDIGNLSLFGYEPRETYTGRAPLEAANQGIRLEPGQVAFRCNLVTLRDGVMEDFTAGHITSGEAAELVSSLNAARGDWPVFFSAGVSYRHLAVVTAEPEAVPGLVSAQCTPPHDITGRPYGPHLPSGEGAELVRSLMAWSEPLLRDHPVNRARVAAGKAPATSIWLWGQGLPPRMQTYPERFGLSGAVISAVDLVNGLGLCAGLRTVPVPGATGYLDTDYAAKVAAALGALEQTDFVFVHVEAPDETSHQGRIDLKIQAIEDFDARVVKPCLEAAGRFRPLRILIAPDHITAISTRTHAVGPVPFAVLGAGVAAGTARAYSERAAEAAGIRITQGYRLTPHVIQADAVSSFSLNGLDK